MKRITSMLLSIVLMVNIVVIAIPASKKEAYAATTNQKNIVARADYMYNSTWVCKKTISGWKGNYTFYEGNTYRLPYAWPVTSGAYIGYGISVEDFLSVAADSSSSFYSKQSYWSGATSNSTYYGNDCSAFVSWCWGISRSTTYDIPKKATYIGGVTTSNCTNVLQLGDALNSNDHVILVTDLKYDSNGAITQIEITEQTPPQLKRSYYTPSQLSAKYSSGYSIYRYTGTVPAAPVTKIDLPDTLVDLGSNFTAKITNVASAKNLSIAVLNTGNNVILYHDSDSTAQQWKFIRQSDGSYEITNVKYSECMDVANADSYSGTNVQIHEDNDTNAQRWYIYEVNGKYVFRPACSIDCVLNVAGGATADSTNIEISTYAASESQLFTIKKMHAETPSIRWWLSETEYGDEISEFKAGTRYYFCYRLYDRVTGKDWDDVVKSNYTVKLTFYNPDGSIKYTNSNVYDYDQSWISSFFDEVGNYKYGVVVEGDYVYSRTESFTVAENPIQVYSSAKEVSLTLGDTESQTINAWYSGYYKGNCAISWGRDNTNVSCSWGEWTDDGYAPLTITANSMGTTNVTISIKDKDSGTILDSTTVIVTVSAKEYIVSYNANGGNGAPGSQAKYHNKTLTLSSTKPVRSGYTFLGWSTSSIDNNVKYQSGDNFTDNTDITLYAVWKKGCEGGTHNYSNGECVHCGADDPNYMADKNVPTIIVDTINGKPGDNVTVKVTIKNNPGFGGMAYDIKYDETVLELVSYEIGLGNAICTDSGVGAYLNKINFQYAGTSNVTGDGTLVTITFKIKETANKGITAISIIPEYGTFFTYSSKTEKDFDVNCVNGGVNIADHISGDVNGDGKVNNRDAARLLQKLAGWEVEVVDTNLDANGDGKINNRDAARIMQYLAGWEVELN